MPSKKAAAPAPKSTAPLVIHELNNRLQHRIVIVENGVADTGLWAESHELATHRNYLANNEAKSPLPIGVFKVQRIASQELGI